MRKTKGGLRRRATMNRLKKRERKASAVVRTRKVSRKLRSNLVNPELAKLRQGATAVVAPGPIIRNSGGRGREGDWVDDTLME